MGEFFVEKHPPNPLVLTNRFKFRQKDRAERLLWWFRLYSLLSFMA